ncbi:MAG: TerB family tellurite resistance protein [Deltaproteobacteria bacterium]|nr:MAG: TerB family tellurite resistance protein [Deltaproteobacteria bacterium]
MRFVCSFAWADLEIADPERTFVADLMQRLELTEEDRTKALEWLAVPPRPEEIDPTEVPREHRQLFLKIVLEMVQADGRIDGDEIETYALFEQLLR